MDAEILVSHVLGTSRSELALQPKRKLSRDEADALEALIARRETREPLAYVLGEWGFRRLTLTVDRRVLVPRPETEVVVERCLRRLAGISEPRDLGDDVPRSSTLLAPAHGWHDAVRARGVAAHRYLHPGLESPLSVDR